MLAMGVEDIRSNLQKITKTGFRQRISASEVFLSSYLLSTFD